MRAEDYDLWFRMYAAGYRGCNLQTPYYRMRDDMNACHRRKFRFALNEAWVRFRGYRLLGLPCWTYFCALRPIAVGMLPKSIYLRLHRRRQNKKERSK
jgi:glycosyltransferase EpsE